MSITTNNTNNKKIIIPAIDLKDGQCVRLKQGIMDDATIFSKNPPEMALHWLNLGAKRLHLVDLNGAFAGKPKNEGVIKEILQEVADKIPVQLGGGIRDLKIIENCLKIGLQYVIIGTAAVQNPDFVKQACKEFSGHIMLGIDAKNGYIATDGWAKISTLKVLEFAKTFEGLNVNSIFYTDIGRDGMLSGLNLEMTENLAKNISIPVIASGGLSSLQDIENLQKNPCENLIGTIAGRAIYDGSLNFQQAVKILEA